MPLTDSPRAGLEQLQHQQQQHGIETPGKKRKRQADTNPFLSFSDQTFSIPSSTPIHSKQIDGGAFENPSFRASNKENYNAFSDSFLEVKSIAELAGGTGVENPFEVTRKPPKKKKKHSSSIEDSCFVNPGLNLNAADKPVNPFEVMRDDEGERREPDVNHCFVNSALNIRGAEVSESINPFEIARPKDHQVVGVPVREEEELKGIENLAMEMPPTYAIAVPFTPSLKHRIDFQSVAANALLTPCQMLANNLVFSPEPGAKTGGVNSVTPKRAGVVTKRKSLSVISEEPIDIGEELDYYQLELENSLNEAKVRKQLQRSNVPGSIGRRARRSLIDVKNVGNMTLKMQQLEADEAQDESLVPEEQEAADDSPNEEDHPIVATPTQVTYIVTKETTVREEIQIDITNPDVQFEEVDDFEDEEQDVELLNNPAPFQRAYRKKEPLANNLAESEFKQPMETVDAGVAHKGKSHKVRDVIRRSFRKLIPKHQHGTVETDPASAPVPSAHDEPPHGGLLSTIRHSLRRRSPRASKKPEAAPATDLEMSIIAEGPRSVFKQPSLPNDYRSIGMGATTLRGSLRRSTKEVRKQMMKSVFGKSEPPMV